MLQQFLHFSLRIFSEKNGRLLLIGYKATGLQQQHSVAMLTKIFRRDLRCVLSTSRKFATLSQRSKLISQLH